MNCNCNNLPIFSYYLPGSDLSRKLRPNLKFMERTKDKELHQCTVCESYWRIDRNTFATDRFVWFIPNYREDWAEYSLESKEKELLLVSRNGTSPNLCIWSGCDEKQLNGMAYCVEHTYERGIRS